MRLSALLLVVAAACFGQTGSTLNFVGVAINTSDPESPLAAPIRMTLIDKVCTLSISPPLTGSGSCIIKNLDKETGHIEIASMGASNITWSGTIKGNLISGFYRVEAGAQVGSFYLAIVDKVEESAKASPRTTQRSPRMAPGNCIPAIESTISGEIEGWDGETIFKLDNGQIWQQAVYDYTYFYAYRPEVTIYETSEGCRMKVEDEEDTVVVKRIK